MKRKAFCSWVLSGLLVMAVGGFLIWGGCASAGQIREIVLGDGSVILAEVVSLRDGVYTLRSEAMGEIQVEDTAIRAIRSPGAIAENPAGISPRDGADITGPQMEAMKESVMGNPGLLGMVFSLKNDPDILRILQNPEIMSRVMSGDIESLQTDPEFAKLMENPKIQEIVQEMTR